MFKNFTERTAGCVKQRNWTDRVRLVCEQFPHGVRVNLPEMNRGRETSEHDERHFRVQVNDNSDELTEGNDNSDELTEGRET